MSVQTSMIGHNSEIVAYSEFRAQLGDLRKINSEVAFDYEDPKGNKDARSHIYKLRQTKAAVEKARQKEKAESLEYGRRVDADAKTIILEIEEMIDVHNRPLEVIEQREKDRVASHENNLSEIEVGGQQTAERWQDLPLQAMKDRLAEIDGESISADQWEEFALRAAQAKEAALALIRDAIDRREKHDAEQAELARLRTESEARERADREEKIRQEAAAAAAKEAEQKASEERERVASEAALALAAAERREIELKLAAETAERQKVEAEQHAANAAKEAEERLQRDAAEKSKRETDEAAEREADKKHRGAINRDSVGAFVKGGLTKDAAKQAVTLIAQKSIPHIHISY